MPYSIAYSRHSEGMKSSIGVGSGGGVLLVLAGIALVFYFHMKRGSSEAHAELNRPGMWELRSGTAWSGKRII
jgi:hypothetical protein